MLKIEGFFNTFREHVAGYQARARLVRFLRMPDFNVALLEDLVAIGGSLFIVSRF
jgi:uncharacterized membrane protein